MNSTCTRFCVRAMILISILTSLTLITTVNCAPAIYGRKGTSANFPGLLWLVDQQMPELENEMYETGNNPGAAIVRTKRIGSLSIVNSLDVLRQRVLLELARRKALQDQRQIDANRRLLESIGKRSVPAYEVDSSQVIQEELENQDQNPSFGRMSEKVDNWLNENSPIFLGDQRDQTSHIKSGEFRLL